LTIKIQNPILCLDCQSKSNPPNWIAIRIEQSNPAKPTRETQRNKLEKLKHSTTVQKGIVIFEKIIIFPLNNWPVLRLILDLVSNLVPDFRYPKPIQKYRVILKF